LADVHTFDATWRELVEAVLQCRLPGRSVHALQTLDRIRKSLPALGIPQGEQSGCKIQ